MKVHCSWVVKGGLFEEGVVELNSQRKDMWKKTNLPGQGNSKDKAQSWEQKGSQLSWAEARP